MDKLLREALEPVLGDLKAAGLDAPAFEDTDWMGDPEYAFSMMWASDGSGSGVSVQRAAPLYERVAAAADRVQEWTIESQLWGCRPTNWPRCPHHPDGHPLEASTADQRAVWICPADRRVVSVVGGL